MEQLNIKPTKRKFIPSFDSAFGDQKRQKSDKSSEIVLQPNPYPLSWDKRLELQSKSSSSTKERENLINSLQFTNFAKPCQIQQKPTQNPSSNSRIIYKAKPAKNSSKIEDTKDFSANTSYSTAQSLRTYSLDSSLLHKSHKLPTVPQPFNLSDSRYKQTKVLNETYEFTAREMPDFSIPFNIKPSLKIPTKPADVFLRTSERADKREIFHEKMWQKEREMEYAKQLENEEREKREKEEIKLIRKQMEFKANPLSNTNFFTIKPSNVPLTVPQGPQLYTEARSFFRSL